MRDGSGHPGVESLDDVEIVLTGTGAISENSPKVNYVANENIDMNFTVTEFKE